MKIMIALVVLVYFEIDAVRNTLVREASVLVKITFVAAHGFYTVAFLH